MHFKRLCLLGTEENCFPLTLNISPAAFSGTGKASKPLVISFQSDFPRCCSHLPQGCVYQDTSLAISFRRYSESSPLANMECTMPSATILPCLLPSQKQEGQRVRVLHLETPIIIYPRPNGGSQIQKIALPAMSGKD